MTGPLTATTAFELEIESDIDAGRFARILATVVNGSAVFLETVTIGGAVIYPVRTGSSPEQLTLRTCRFRVRHGQMLLGQADVEAIASRVQERFALLGLRPAGESLPPSLPAL